MSDLDALLRKMDGTTPEGFAKSATKLGLRDYGFPSELEARAYVDGFGDLGIDGLALAIDNPPLLDLDDATDALEGRTSSSVLRIFMLQAKSGEYLNEKDVVLFGAAVQKFLTLSRQDILRLKPNGDAFLHWGLYDKVRKTVPMLAAKTHVTALFAYAGQWRDFSSVNIAREQAEKNIANAPSDLRLEFVIWGNQALIDAGHRVGPEFRRTLDGVRLLPLPGHAGNGYLGYVTAKDFATFASRPHNGKREMLDFMFYDNVRHFLGTAETRDNPGAVGLQKTLKSGQQSQVLLCHNGIVIVATHGKLAEGGHSIQLTSPQIVNGCQSTGVLIENADALDNCHVPLKIVLTEDEDLKDAIILASNTQAAVDDYDMLARNQGLLELQNIFQRGEAPPPERLWLQRRRNEPVDWPENWEWRDWNRVLRPRHLLDAYAATILDTPHTAHDKPAAILELARNGTVFNLSHEPTLYRALGWLIVAGRRWALRHERRWQDRFAKSAPRAYPARHQYVWALWRLADVDPDAIHVPHLTKSGAANKRFQTLINTLVEHLDALGDAAGDVVDQAATNRSSRLGSDLMTRRYFTEEVQKVADAVRYEVRARLGLSSA